MTVKLDINLTPIEEKALLRKAEKESISTDELVSCWFNKEADIIDSDDFRYWLADIIDETDLASEFIEEAGGYK